MARFIDPFTDTGFKIIFGKENQSNDFLRLFLNGLLEGEPGFEPIVKITYRNTEHTPDSDSNRTTRYDIHCETESGHHYIVEMQRKPQPYFMARAVFYVSRKLTSQGKRDTSADGEWKYELTPVIGVFFCNFFLDEDHRLVRHAMLCDTATDQPITPLMRYVFIQLPAFNKKEEECETPLDEWIYILKNMKNMDKMPFTTHREVFERLARVTNYEALSEPERERYDYDLKMARDYNAEMSYARTEGHKIGYDEGMQQGMQQGTFNTYRGVIDKMAGMGMNDDEIAKMIPIGVAEIRSIRCSPSSSANRTL